MNLNFIIILLYIYYFQVEKEHAAAGHTLRAAFSRAESMHPGFTYDLVRNLVAKGDLAVNMNEAILRLQGSLSETECKLIFS